MKKIATLFLVFFFVFSIKGQETVEFYRPTVVTSSPSFGILPNLVETTISPDPNRVILAILSDGYTSNINQKRLFLRAFLSNGFVNLLVSFNSFLLQIRVFQFGFRS